MGDLGLIPGFDPWVGKIPWRRKWQPTPVFLSEESPVPMQETQVQSLGGEDPLEEEMATHSSILARRIPWTEEPGRLQSMGSQKSMRSQRFMGSQRADMTEHDTKPIKETLTK